MEAQHNYHLPEAFVESMNSQFGNSFTQALCEAILHTDAPTSIRWNKKIAAPVSSTPIPWEADAAYLSERPLFVADPLWHAGAYYVQEASSMLIAYLLKQWIDPSKASKVLDLCAAPGGKSTHILNAINEESILVCNELIGKRASILKENIIRWGSKQAIVCNNEVTHFSHFQNTFDFVLLDAPCSGEGMFRKDPASMDEWSMQNVQTCSERQAQILATASSIVKEAGYIIYSTCTYNQQENAKQIEAFLKEFPFEAVSITLPAEWGFQPITGEHFTAWQAFPHLVKGEGFFCCVLRKKSHVPSSNNQVARLKPINHFIPSAIAKNELNFFVDALDTYQLIQKNESIFALPKAQQSFINTVLQQMNVIYAGIALGQFKKDLFIPDHALAMSNAVAKSIASLDLSEQEAIQYLKKESFQTKSALSLGWHKVCFKGVCLGWAKVLQGGRLNNYYPIEWRIKVNLERLQASIAENKKA